MIFTTSKNTSYQSKLFTKNTLGVIFVYKSKVKKSNHTTILIRKGLNNDSVTLKVFHDISIFLHQNTFTYKVLTLEGRQCLKEKTRLCICMEKRLTVLLASYLCGHNIIDTYFNCARKLLERFYGLFQLCNLRNPLKLISILHIFLFLFLLLP